MRIPSLVIAVLIPALCAPAQESQPVALTIYNQNFAVARTSIDLDLHPGINEVTSNQVTSRLEPDSVVLRDSSGMRAIHVIEQNYDAAVVSQEWLLQKYEGKSIDFQISPGQIIEGRIIRAGSYSQPEYSYNGQLISAQPAQPLIAVNGRMQFQLPGTPLFPSSTEGLLLKPTLRWQIHSDIAAHFSAELAYITGGFDWEATYNVVAPERSDVTGSEKDDVHGWVTIHNRSGSDFPSARIKLMAGDIAKIMPQASPYAMNQAVMAKALDSRMEAGVTQKAFDDFHLYDLNRLVSLREGETKQLEFIEATAVSVKRTYVYDSVGSALQPIYAGNVNQNQGYGLDNENRRVVVIEEIKNSESNHLGMPLPAGRLRLYRRDSDGQMEFIGESMIGHTPAEDSVKIPTGSAFDLKGSRRQTDFHVEYNKHMLDETFAIKITNQKQQAVNVSVMEHMYRGENWEITASSTKYQKLDSHTIDFPVQVPAKGATMVTYTVHYTW